MDIKNDWRKLLDQNTLMEKDIAQSQKTWTHMYKSTQDNLNAQIEEVNQNRGLQQIQSLIEQIKNKESQVADTQVEIQQILQNQTQALDDAQLNELKLAVAEKTTQYKLLLNDKAALFEEMYSNAILLINRDQ